MKKILLKKATDMKQRVKRFSLSHTREEAEQISTVTKSFCYKVSPTPGLSPVKSKPKVFMVKEFDTVNNIERFYFKVTGRFYTVHERVVVRVNFEHDLRIEICWKKDFSPKKSVVLTE